MTQTSADQREHGRGRLPDGVRTLDVAEGVLIGLRGCRRDVAFDELIAASRRHDVPVFTLSSALVALAAGDHHGSDGAASVKAERAAIVEWGALMSSRPKPNCADHVHPTLPR